MICLLGWASPARADEIILPDSPVGRQLAALNEAFASEDPTEFIKSHFDREFLEQFAMEDHLDFFRQVREMHGSFEFEKIEQASEDRLVVLGRSVRQGAWRRISLDVQPAPPHRIVGLDFQRATEPQHEAAALQAGTEAEAIKALEARLDEKAARDEFSGAVLIARDDEHLLYRAWGMASKRFEVPNRVTTKFNIGSLNKSFTSLAIAQLLEQGKLSLDHTVDRYVEGFPEEIGSKVTIRHLLTMSSGMGSYWNDEYDQRWHRIRTVEDLLDIVRKQPLDFEPGTSRQYSNSGYVVLGAVIEKVSGMSYYDYVREKIFEPAGMTDTDSYEMDQVVPDLAIGYTRNRSTGENRYQNNLFLHGVKGSPAGGGFSTLLDLFRYQKALRQYKLAGEKYSNLVMNFFEDDGAPGGIGIAGGAPVGINAVLEADFGSGYTVIVLSNYDPPFAEEFGLEASAMLLGVRDRPVRAGSDAQP